MTRTGTDKRGLNCGCDASTRHLTRREVDVLLLITAGFENAEVAAQLSISVRTVESHRRSMLKKSGARNWLAMITHCYAAGILLPSMPASNWSGEVCLFPNRDPVTGHGIGEVVI